MEMNLRKEWIIHLRVIDLCQNMQAPNSTEIIAMRPPGRPHSVLLSSAQAMKGFPITLASSKEFADGSTIGKLSLYRGRTASLMTEFWSIHHTDHVIRSFFRKIQKIDFFFIENGWIEKRMAPSENAPQDLSNEWMVLTILNSLGQFLCPGLGDRSHYQSSKS
jgi:hypothetical protein